jgi:hypothetical protein
MQPTAQAVGRRNERGTSPEGAKETDKASGELPETARHCLSLQGSFAADGLCAHRAKIILAQDDKSNGGLPT